MKIEKPSAPWTNGEIAKIKCKTHGKHAFVAGVDFPTDLVKPLPCPYCQRTMAAGRKSMVGEGYIDDRGVAYIVDERGTLRKLQNVSETRAERIRLRRDHFRAMQNKKERGTL